MNSDSGPELEAVEKEIEEAVSNGRSESSFAVSAECRKSVENRGMEVVTERYESNDWYLKDVSGSES